MQHATFRVLVATVLLAALAAPSAASQSAWDTTRVATEPDASYNHDFTYPQTDGTWVVWADYGYHPHSSTSTIRAARLDQPEPFSISVIGGNHFDFDEGRVTWAEHITQYHSREGIFVFDLATRTETTVHTDGGFGGWLPVLGRTLSKGVWTPIVTWIQDGGLVYCNIPCSGEPTLLYDIPYGNSVTNLTAESDQLMWLQSPAYGDWNEPPVLMSQRLGDPTPRILVPAVSAFAVAGATVAYVTQPVDSPSQLLIRDTNGSIRHVADDADTVALSDDGRLVFWTDARQQVAPEGEVFEVFGFDLRTSSRFVAFSTTRTDEHRVWIPTMLDSDNGTLVWILQEWADDIDISLGNYLRFGSEVHAARVTELLPAARRDDPGRTDPAWTWFPETGHYLSGEFRSFWEANGGLPVFGYPLTEEFSELNTDTEQWHTVQITERQRYEWHPENAGTPYTVLLGRLGAELLVAEGRNWRSFPTADPATPHYLPETGHSIAPEFWAYWSSHGLDLGDPAVSFRESLALFGYPLSEPALEKNADGDVVRTQYFERAVFEYHPDNPDEYRVLLRRLGAESLTARGW